MSERKQFEPFKEYRTPTSDAYDWDGWVPAWICREFEQRYLRTHDLLEYEKQYIKDMDNVIDELGVAVSCIGPREELHRAICALKNKIVKLENQLQQK